MISLVFRRIWDGDFGNYSDVDGGRGRISYGIFLYFYVEDFSFKNYKEFLIFW